MNKLSRIALIIVFFLLLVSIRAIAIEYFYDPLIQYFKYDYNYMPVPEMDFGKYYFFLFLRYSLNTIVSLAIIYLVFLNFKTVVFAIKLYIVAFVILGAILFVLLKFDILESYLLTFYVRRFLIHPLLLLILLPAFYYQKLQIKTN